MCSRSLTWSGCGGDGREQPSLFQGPPTCVVLNGLWQQLRARKKCSFLGSSIPGCVVGLTLDKPRVRGKMAKVTSRIKFVGLVGHAYPLPGVQVLARTARQPWFISPSRGVLVGWAPKKSPDCRLG